MFDMSIKFDHQTNAGGWQISSPGILGSSTMDGSIRLLLEAGIENIRAKSLSLTSYLVYLLNEKLPGVFRVVTPDQNRFRSGHISIVHPEESLRINEALKARGVIPDFRPPDIIRIAPIALYNTFEEVWILVQHLKEITENKEYEQFSKQRKAIS